MKRNILIGGAVVIMVLVIYLFSNSADESVLTAKVERGDLNIEVVTTGELEARNSVKIQGPSSDMRSARIYEARLNKLVPEGTIVKKGDFVGQLDLSTLNDNIKNKQDDLTKVESEYTETQLDTALTLREGRDKILNLTFEVEEMKIKLEQSAFEPPATIKQAKMDVEKTQRTLKQEKQNYQIRKKQMVAKMNVAYAKREQVRRFCKMLEGLREKFTIRAPEDGMVIYASSWSGKITEGETVRAWDPTVATLPDLSEMVSRTYVNEVDIRRIKKGQTVAVGLDAFPDKHLTGKVTSVANVGEQKPKADSKVFEVTVLINEYDSILRPAMTTSNIILTDQIQDCLFAPLEILHSQGDSINYVIVKNGLSYSKQEVKLGQSNDQYTVLLGGVEEGATLALNEPESIKDEEVQLLK